MNIKTIKQVLQRMQTSDANQKDVQDLADYIHQTESILNGRQQAEEYQRWPEKITGLLAAASRVAAPLDAEQITTILAQELCDLLEQPACLVSNLEPAAGTVQPYSLPPAQEKLIPSAWRAPRRLEDIPYRFLPGSAPQPIHLSLKTPGLPAEEKKFLESLGLHALLVFPLVHMDKTSLLGIIEIPSAHPDQVFTNEEIAIAQILANHAAIAIQHARLFNSFRQRAEELELIRQASLKLTASLELNEVLSEILKSTLKALPGVEDAHIFLYQDEKLSFGAALWADGRTTRPWMEPRPEGLTYTVARTGEMILINDYQSHPLFTAVAQQWQGSIVGFPLKIGSRVVGVMNIAHKRTNAFEDADLRLLRLLADQAAIAIINARLHQIVHQQARTDPVTELYNRRAFDGFLEQEVRRTDRYGHPVSLLMIDMNDFKYVNDHFGHPAGDSVLRQIAQLLIQYTRDTDYVCRYGGDEFAVVLTETSLQEAIPIAERLLQAVQSFEAILPDGRRLAVDFCIGIGAYPEHAAKLDEFLSVADQALYRAKNPEKEARLRVYRPNTS